jgi:dTDP-4-amino-4,6-dideoxygalactose transaminase
MKPRTIGISPVPGRNKRIGVNVCYLPVYIHSSYASLGSSAGLCPVAEDAYTQLLSLPMSHGLGRSRWSEWLVRSPTS